MSATSETQMLKKKVENGEIDKKLLTLSLYKILMEWLREHPKESRKLIKIAKTIRRGLRDDYDFVCAITGREGSGKSTLMIILAILIDKNFRLGSQMSLLPTTGEIKRMFKRIKQYGVLGIDEAIKILHKQDWYNVLQKVIVQMYATERFQNKATFLCIPRFTDLNENFRNHRVNSWIDVLDRGVAFVKTPIPVSYFSDPWMMDEMSKKYKFLLKTKKGSQITIEDMERIEKKNPCFVDTIYFPDLPTDIKEIYLELKIQARDKEEKGDLEELPKDKVRRALALFIVHQKSQGVKHADLATQHQMSESMIKTLAKEGRIWMKKQKKQENKEREGNW
jgi:primosomal protein N'